MHRTAFLCAYNGRLYRIHSQRFSTKKKGPSIPPSHPMISICSTSHHSCRSITGPRKSCRRHSSSVPAPLAHEHTQKHSPIHHRLTRSPTTNCLGVFYPLTDATHFETQSPVFERAPPRHTHDPAAPRLCRSDIKQPQDPKQGTP